MEFPSPNPKNCVSSSEFVETTCLSFLRTAQNSDGGWSFSTAGESRVEPTAWALLALEEASSSTRNSDTERIARGREFLRASQLADGSWPAARGQDRGSWVTAPACWALAASEGFRDQMQRGIAWLAHEKTGDSGAWWRLMRKFASSKEIVGQSDAYFGWSWTERTASWVEPTSYALIVLRRHAARSGNTRQLQERAELAEAMLLDRMCSGGGWNCGNPLVYGVAGQAQIGPTVWALLALREGASRNSEKIENSLEWLERNWKAATTPESLALARIGLRTYGRDDSGLEEALRKSYLNEDLIWSVPAVAWSVLAMCATQNWLEDAAPAIAGKL